jgi:hypothetical protein
VKRAFTTFLGIDLGGARGKTTALARLSLPPPGAPTMVLVDEVSTRRQGAEPWVDDLLVEQIAAEAARTPGVAVAINAPLTQTACARCRVAVCPGVEACVDPAVEWLRSEGRDLLEGVLEDRDSIAAVPARGFVETRAPTVRHRNRPRIAPYSQRATEIVLACDRGLASRDTLGQATGPIGARASHLVRRLQGLGFRLNENLLEVSPAATVAALFGPRRARGYKRDADPWETRASIVEDLRDLGFARTSRMSREEVLRNDHCFEALLSGYTAYLWARDGWQLPDDGAEVFAVDGWIWAPPRR